MFIDVICLWSTLAYLRAHYGNLDHDKGHPSVLHGIILVVDRDQFFYSKMSLQSSGREEDSTVHFKHFFHIPED
jgi:hypothetical protein